MASNHKRIKMSKNSSCSTIEEEVYPDTSDFSDIVKAPGFVDKTLLLKLVLRRLKQMILITAPRRFAKSTNMDMVKKFVEIEIDEAGVVVDREESPNRKIFEDNNLKIFQDQEFFDQHFATYPVIHITFKNVLATSYEGILNGFRAVLNNTYSEHEYLFKSQIWSKHNLEIDLFKSYYYWKTCITLHESDIVRGIQLLSKFLYYHFGKKKVFVLIDEYDAPINKTILEKDIDINLVNSLLEQIFSNTLKENKFVERALLTGISYFASVGLSGANNIKKYMFLENHPFVEYYGLTDEEFIELVSKFKLDDESINEVKSYYNGYMSRNNIKLYSLWSVLNYLETKQLKSYWEKSGLVRGVNNALRFPLIQMMTQKLLKSESQKIQVFDNISLENIVELQHIILGHKKVEINNPDLFWNFLLEQGYLTYESTDDSIRIPNKAICNILTEELYTFYGQTLNDLLDKCSAAFNEISVSDIDNFQQFVKTFQELVNTKGPDIIIKNERIFRSLLFCVICRSQSQVCDDAELVTKNGATPPTRHRPDLIAVKDKIGFMIEIKFKRDCKEALKQIIDKEYNTKFNSDEFKNLLEHKVYVVVNLSEDCLVTLAVLVNPLNIKSDIDKALYFPPRC